MSLILIYIILSGTVLASGSLIFVLKTTDQRVLKLLLAFSGAFLIGISFLKLVPEIYSTASRYAGLFILAGFLIQLILELITKGAEHGHIHSHAEEEHINPFVLLIGLCIHAFLEGTPIVEGYDASIRQTFVAGLVIHKIPISITLMSLFINCGCSRRKAFTYLGIFALMTPLGSIISRLIHFGTVASMTVFYTYIMAIVVGIFLHVSTSILFETGENHQYNLKKFLVVCFGILVAFGISLL
jgi:zinc and cadmium transporter